MMIIIIYLGVLGLLGCGEDQRRVGGGILRLVLVNGGKVTRVTDNDLEGRLAGVPRVAGFVSPALNGWTYGAGGLELVERARHVCVVVVVVMWSCEGGKLWFEKMDG